jgi:hypothetical protein
MTETKQPLVLSNLPLEVRHKIFEYVAVRTTKPKKLLRYWFEKKEATELAAKYVAANPGCLAPIIVYPNARYDPPDTDEELEDEGEDYEERAMRTRKKMMIVVRTTMTTKMSIVRMMKRMA